MFGAYFLYYTTTYSFIDDISNKKSFNCDVEGVQDHACVQPKY